MVENTRLKKLQVEMARTKEGVVDIKQLATRMANTDHDLKSMITTLQEH